MYKESFDINLKGLDKECEMGLIKPTYKIILPANPGNFQEQWDNCLKQLSGISKQNHFKPIRVNVFVKSLNQADYLSQLKHVEETISVAYGDDCPPFGVVMQEPEPPNLVALEVGLVNSTEAQVV